MEIRVIRVTVQFGAQISGKPCMIMWEGDIAARLDGIRMQTTAGWYIETYWESWPLVRQAAVFEAVSDNESGAVNLGGNCGTSRGTSQSAE